MKLFNVFIIMAIIFVLVLEPIQLFNTPQFKQL